MARIIDGSNYVAVMVRTSDTGQGIPGAVVTPSAPVFSDQEMTTQVATVTTGADGAARFYAKPGVYTFTTTATGAAAIESVEVLSRALGDVAAESTGAHLTHSGTAPAAAAGANAGTSPPAPVVVAGSDDTRGKITWGTGTTSAAGAQVVVTFASAYGAAPIVTLSPANSATAALNLYVTSVSTTAFTISTQGAPTDSQANTVYAADYEVIG